MSTEKHWDSVLGKLLIGMHEKGEIVSIIISKSGWLELCSKELTNLIAAFEKPQPLEEEQGYQQWIDVQA